MGGIAVRKLITRTIMIFPEFENIGVIDMMRKKYDPLANLVRPHITLVFPFESDISNDEISDILEKRLYNFKPFILTLQGISKVADSYGNYLFLNIIEGQQEIIDIHNILYENEFSKWNLGLPYTPHMTIGKLDNENELDYAFDEIKICQEKFLTTVKKISVEMIGEHEESIIVIEKALR